MPALNRARCPETWQSHSATDRVRRMRETVLEERDGAVLVLTLNRPQQRNAFNRQMWHELRDALRDAQDDPTVHAVVVTGTGGAFSAGQDLGEMTGGAG